MNSYPSKLSELMMAHQPIFTRRNTLFGYELLFRGQDEDQANILDGEVATSQVLVNLCIGITELNEQIHTPFFINITSDLLLSDAFFPIDPQLVYIEILEAQKITPELVSAIFAWRQKGYRFVLDDYQFTLDYDDLLPLVDMVKIDVLATPPMAYQDQINALLDRELTLVAEKVEDIEMFNVCKKMGFKLFQGYYLQRPQLVRGRRVDSGMQMAVELVSELRDDNISIDKVVKLVEKNPKLSYQLLRILNSPICGMPQKVESLRAAVVLIGIEKIRKWALLITLTASSNQPVEIFRTILTRAHCCQSMCTLSGKADPETGFIAGLMSGIDVVLAMDKEEALKQIALSDHIRDIILNNAGEIGSYLRVIQLLEKNNWDKLAKLPLKSKVTLSRCYGEGLLWANATLETIF